VRHGIPTRGRTEVLPDVVAGDIEPCIVAFAKEKRQQGPGSVKGQGVEDTCGVKRYRISVAINAEPSRRLPYRAEFVKMIRSDR
jgi:hypothetical protein